MNKWIQKITIIAQSKFLQILTNGFMSIAAVSIAGSLFVLLKSLPIPVWQDFLSSSGLGEILAIPVSITSDLMALYTVVAMAYTLAKAYDKDAFGAAIISLGAFMILTPFTTNTMIVDEGGNTTPHLIEGVLPISSVGAQGIFLAIITGLIGARLYVFFLDKGWKIIMPESVPENVTKMFEMMIPGGLVFVVFLIVRWGLSLTSFETAQTFIYTILQRPLIAVGGGLTGALVFITVSKLLWVFGIHGGMVTYAAFSVIMRTVLTDNMSAYASGLPAPYIDWAWVMPLMDFSVLGLTIIMLFRSKSKQYKLLGKISLPTSLFMITEPVMFGMPIVMNFILAIPFVLLQPVNLLLTLLVTKIGLVAPPTGAGINNMIPGPIQMALVNSHWSGFVWGIILLSLNIIVWYPFFKIIDSKAATNEIESETKATVQGEIA
ncbi:PTS sugar transporter subunit IIC [Enterococcus casseliflavus]|uniref:PTS sugar transporter subunit IIC n=1 Tax=Enterococcus casseliflavus TaxID=37734 RepID=UPI0018833E1B|nr:PTS transporter subunit EIIC [Enterococcus casseliflavus]MBE9909316.1 PTS sugar transporter subunit IIC [Enterococcus casseliflavus]